MSFDPGNIPKRGSAPKEPIYIIESPGAEDLYKARNEGDALVRILSLAEIETNYYFAANDDMFDRAIDDIVIRINHDHPKSMPIIHISAHGAANGIALTDGDLIEWDDLTERMSYLDDLVGPAEMPENFPFRIPRINLSLSSCSAFSNYRGALKPGQPFQFLLGPSKNVGWCEALLGFSTFYYQSFVRGRTFWASLQAMNSAVSTEDYDIFEIHTEHDTQEVIAIIDKIKAEKGGNE